MEPSADSSHVIPDVLNKSEDDQKSLSSNSNTNTNIASDVEALLAKVNTIIATKESGNSESPSLENDPKSARSMSDSQTEKLVTQEIVDILPSLPDDVLNKLGVLGGEVPREKMSDEEIEKKFITLALAFSIDATTLKDRRERQRRYRDQTEANLNREIDKLTQKITSVQPKCMDAQMAELLTGLLTQIDFILRASYLSAVSAERFGAVQYEERLTEAVNVMISHVSHLQKRQDSMTKQLQYTRNVLKDNNLCEKPKVKQDVTTDNRFITKRRASIASIVQPPENDNKVSVSSANGDVRKIVRRSSDLATKISAVVRPTRSSRFELGVDLGKINEGILDNNVQNNQNNESESEIKSSVEEPASTQIKLRKSSKGYKRFLTNVYKVYETTAQDGRLQDFFMFSALMCFALSTIILGNMLVELEFGKRGVDPGVFWNNLLSYFPNIINNYFLN